MIGLASTVTPVGTVQRVEIVKEKPSDPSGTYLLCVAFDEMEALEAHFLEIAKRCLPAVKSPKLQIHTDRGVRFVAFMYVGTGLRPPIVDSQLNPIPDMRIVRRGARVRVATMLMTFSRTNATVYFVPLAIQMIERAPSVLNAFKVVEGGYVHRATVSARECR